MEQAFPIEATVPLVGHDAVDAALGVAQALDLVDLQKLPQDVLQTLGEVRRAREGCEDSISSIL